MTFCHSAVKCFLCIVNLIFSLLGLVITGFGIVCVIYKEHPAIRLYNLDTMVFYGIIIVGAVIFFVGFSGCFGAIRESHCLLIMYSIFIVLLVIIKIAVIIFVFKNKDMIKEETTITMAQIPDDQLSTALNSTKMSSEMIAAFHVVEFMGYCCGTTGPASYFNVTVPTNATVPLSCCPIERAKLGPMCDFNYAYKTGCKAQSAVDQAMKFLNVIAYSVIGIAVLEMIALFSAITTCPRKSYDGYYEYD